MDCDWEQDFVNTQSELLGRAGKLVREKIEQMAKRNKAGHDAKVRTREPIKIGARVLLRRCAFEGRHKIKHAYYDETYIVTGINSEGDVYRIRPSQGGSERIVH